MSETKPIMTTAIRQLIEHNVQFTSHFYKYEEKGGTAVSSRELGVDEHVVIKTLIMETETKQPIIVLMHGDCQVSTKQLARQMNVKSVTSCDPEVANKHSGFMVGGTSPFGTKKVMPVYLEKTICGLERIFLNGGKRGFLINLKTQDLVRVLHPQIVEITA
jgi:Cys-tRNA(Pro) deacylase